jgi:hypothetical protein
VLRPERSPTESLNVNAAETAALAAVRTESNPSVKDARPAARITAAAGPERRALSETARGGRSSTRGGASVAAVS